MFQTLLNHINSILPLTPEEEEHIKSLFIDKKYRKKQYLAQEGDPCKYAIFVVKGAIVSYATDQKGNDSIMQFATEGWWITEFNSFTTGQASVHNINAVEDSHVLLLSHENYERMLAELPKLEKYWRVILERRMIAMQRRIMIYLTYSLEDNYKRLLEVYPDISNRFPQHFIASYLGISAETLSRLRKSINSKK